MTQTPAPVTPDQVGRTAQIIVGALMMGQIIFLGIALMQGQGKPAVLGPIALLGAVITAMMILVATILSRLSPVAAIRKLAEQRPENWRTALAPIYTTKTILANAPIEGAGFFNGVAYLIHAHWISLACAGIGLALMAITFPSQMKFESWAEQVQRENS